MTKEKKMSWICPVCGKRFTANSTEWTYKREKNGKLRMFCCWTCYRTIPEKRTYNKRG